VTCLYCDEILAGIKAKSLVCAYMPATSQVHLLQTTSSLNTHHWHCSC